MTINATLINLYNVCPRECWFHANGIQMEHTSETVTDGKLLHETSYPDRSVKRTEMQLEAQFNNIPLFGKIDFYDAKRKIIHEIKRSDKVEEAHIWQVKFYMWLFRLNGVSDVKSIIEYPLLRQTETIELSEEDIQNLQNLILKIQQLQESEICPPVLNARICKSCSYYELCYISET